MAASKLGSRARACATPPAGPRGEEERSGSERSRGARGPEAEAEAPEGCFWHAALGRWVQHVGGRDPTAYR